MSQSAEREVEAGGSYLEDQSVLDLLREWYHVPVLLAVMAAMVAIRLQSYDRYVRGNDVLFSGNDAWYHLREVNYAVRNWPATMPFDPWTYFPFGTSVGQFGTLYDQLVATAALVVGLGSPSDALVAKVLLVAPPVFGALAAIPAYLIGRRLAGRVAGLFGAVLLALLPGVFLSRTLVGHADHNAAEPFFQGMAVAAFVVALAVAEREKPIWELVVDRDVEALRRPLLWSGLAGVAAAIYMWMWPPGVLLIGVFGVFLVLKLTSDVVNGRSPEPVAFVAAVSMAVTAALMFVPFQAFKFSTTLFSLLQPTLALAVAGGAVFMAWLAREWEARDLDTDLYAVAVFGLVVVGFAVLSVASESLFNTIQRNLLRTVGFSAGAQTRTIGEAQPYLSPNILSRQGLTPVNRILSDYGFTLFTGVLAAIWLLAKPLVRKGETRHYAYAVGSLLVVAVLYLVPAVPRGLGGALDVDSSLVGLAIVTAIIVGATLLARYDADRLFVVVWAGFITAAAFTQVRFNYYLAVPVVVLNAYLLGEVVDYLDLGAPLRSLSDVKGYQVMALIAAVLLITAPVLLVPLSIRDTGNPSADRSATAWEVAEGQGPQGITDWNGSLRWVSEQTPTEGRLGGASNDLPYYGTYEETNDFSYPAGAYGVQSWWDYGHWITVRGERIPNANPFQQGATAAANYLLAPTPDAAREVLREQSREGERTRYVMVDWQMAVPSSKFSAPIVFYDRENVSQGDFYTRLYRIDQQQGQITSSFLHRHQRYYDSLMIRLYEYHGSAMEPQPIVLNWDERQVETRGGETVTIRTSPAQGNLTRRFNNMSAAREFVREDGTAQVGGIGAFPAERVPALEHYRLVKASESSALNTRGYQSSLFGAARTAGVQPRALLLNQPAYVKTFERVPGATVEGSGAPPNATVTARVQVRVPASNSTFVYSQRAETDANGEFSMTLPYSTTGYADYGPENGYTNVSVRATGPYTVSTSPRFNESGYIVRYRSNLTVGEGVVNGDREGPLTVTLDRQSQQLQLGDDSSEDSADGNATADGGSTAEGSTTDGGTGGDSTADDTGNGNGNATGSLEPPVDALATAATRPTPTAVGGPR